MQILLGALVAGIDAGRGYIDWPLMGGEFMPSESFAYDPKWTNFFENPALVQFNHRMMGYLVLLAGFVVWLSARKAARGAIRSVFRLILLVMILQATMGVLTIIYVAPLPLAITHQLIAILLFGLVLKARFLCLFPPAERIRGVE